MIGYVGGVGSEDAFWKFVPATLTWSERTPPPLSSIVFAFAIDGKGYVGTANFGQFYAFDPLLDTRARTPARGALPLRVFPNPVFDVLRIAAPDLAGHPYRLYDGGGRPVATGRVGGEGIPVGHLPSGVYTLAVETELGLRTARVVKR